MDLRLFAAVLALAGTSGLSFVAPTLAVDAGQDRKPRLIVLTDIGGDPDDQQSLIRLMHYANEFKIEGLIASAAGTMGELKEATTKPELIREIVHAYGQVQANLAKHAEGFPSAEELNATIKSGNHHRGWHAVGATQDTEGSRWIIERADVRDPRPLNIAIWGGQTDLAQALWRVNEDRGEEGLKAFVSKIRVYDINDQDKIAEQIWSEFPGLFYVLASAFEGKDKRTGAYRGMYLGGDESLVSREWMDLHIRIGHGPLGALYPPNTWTEPNPYGAIKEGDTPSWFYFLPNGVSDSDHPEWGGWGGRFAQNEQGIWRDATDTVDDTTDARATVWRWREAYQNDFAARLDWGATKRFEDANHPPVVILNGDDSEAPVVIDGSRLLGVSLGAHGTSDPDGDELTYRWFAYTEAGSYRDTIDGLESRGQNTSFSTSGFVGLQTIHVVLEVRDSGEPPLIAYRRAVVTVGNEFRSRPTR